MTVWQALATMLALQYKLSEDEFTVQMPGLERVAKKALRAIGTTTAELESEFPDNCLYEGLCLIKNNPEEFMRRARLSMEQTIGNN